MKKLLALLLTSTMVFGLAACSSDDTTTSTGEEVQTLTMATNAEFPPYEFYEGGEIVGIDAEIAGVIAEKIGMELVIEDMAFGSIITAVQSGQADMGMAGMTVTEERLVNVDFTDSYATANQVIIVPEGSDIVDPDGLVGKKIGVQESTTGDIYATGDYGDECIERYAKGAEAVLALNAGLLDAVIIDLEPAKAYVEANEGLVILDTTYATEEYAIAIKKDNTELLELVNGALVELIEDGTVDAIVAKYISAE